MALEEARDRILGLWELREDDRLHVRLLGAQREEVVAEELQLAKAVGVAVRDFLQISLAIIVLGLDLLADPHCVDGDVRDALVVVLGQAAHVRVRARGDTAGRRP